MSIIVTQAKLLLDVLNDRVTFFSCSFCGTLLGDSPSVKTKDSDIVVVLPDIHVALLFDMSFPEVEIFSAKFTATSSFLCIGGSVSKWGWEACYV